MGEFKYKGCHIEIRQDRLVSRNLLGYYKYYVSVVSPIRKFSKEYIMYGNNMKFVKKRVIEYVDYIDSETKDLKRKRKNEENERKERFVFYKKKKWVR